MTGDTQKCPSCGLNQFVNAAETCKRCKRPFKPNPVPTEPEAASKPLPWRHYSSDESDALMSRVAAYVKGVRVAKNLSQRQLAKRIPCPRTYISKIENGGAQPTVVSLMRIAGGLGVPVWQILKNAEENMQNGN